MPPQISPMFSVMLTVYLCMSVCVQGLIALHTNPILANGTAGLATTATAFAAIEVCDSQLCIDTLLMLLETCVWCVTTSMFLLGV